MAVAGVRQAGPSSWGKLHDLATGAARAASNHAAGTKDEELARHWAVAVAELDRGPQAVDLWSSRRVLLRPAPPFGPSARALDHGQQLALAAMTTPGGYFIWQPPGTGKTAAIIGALRAAVTRGRTVLLVSRTPAAVDDVLAALIADDTGIRPGAVVRVRPSGDHGETVSSAVGQHPFLMDDKAAAVLVHRDERLAAIAEAEQANLHHEVRGKELWLRRRVDELGLDAVGLRQLGEQTAVYDEWRWLLGQRQPLRRRRDECLAAIRATVQELSAFDGIENRLTLLASDLASEQAMMGDRSLLVSELDAHEARIATLTKVLTDTVTKRDARLAVEQRLAHLRGELDAVEAAIEQCDREMAARRRVIGDPSAWVQRFGKAEADGSLVLVLEWDGYAQQIKLLGDELRELTRLRTEVEDDCRRERSRLMRQAPVVATTIDALVGSEELRGRRFDAVIVDEVVDTPAFKVFYAAAKADRTVVLVGDFMQSAPADYQAGMGDGGLATADWQTGDVFALAGITDRASAERNSHCVMLSVQYRYPPAIASLSSGLCYDGLLQSAAEPGVVKPGLVEPAGAAVVFHDTSGMRLDFQSVNNSWRCKQTVQLVSAIAQREPASLGFVTFYRAQAELARRLLQYEAPAAECGTAHSFQGREFDAMIVDLMQDDQPRWASLADIHGDARATGAARLLNVAVTRSTRRLHLIGNWEFVRASQAPGMRAIAALDGQPGFELVRH